jgi:Ca-activated chloride channel family protein
MNFRSIILFVSSLGLVLSSMAADVKSSTGKLDATDADGKSLGTCPLKHIAIDAELSGTIARVSVTQHFYNPFTQKIDAAYVFPLPSDSAVDDMEMKIGERVIKGLIMKREKAQQMYLDAKHKGHVASLLDQERPNIFTQSVANIEPGQDVTITIRYSLTLAWEDGQYQLHVPTVVGPRYIPGSPITPVVNGMPSLFPSSPQKRAVKSDTPLYNDTPAKPTDQVLDADRISPPVVQERCRAGHDLSITVNIHAGIAIKEITCETHEIIIVHPEDDKSRACIQLKEGATLPDRDFSLRFRTASETITNSLLTHTDERGKFFTLVLQPPARVKPADVVPRELIFVLDTSGSMSGYPLETSKALMRKAIKNLRPNDRFNLITFAGSTDTMAQKPLDNTAANRQRALRFIDTLQGSGGTEMMKSISAALGGNIDPKKVRIVCFLTDGYVGNEDAIVAAVKKHARTSRVFSFGIGSSVNRFLLSAMASEGKGDAQFVLSPSTAESAAARFYERIDAPVLTDLALDFGDLAVEDIYPQQLPDLFVSQPVIIKGRYTKAGTGVVRLAGRNAAGPYERNLTITLPENHPENAVIASQWARAKVERISRQNTVDVFTEGESSWEKQITELGTTFGLLTKFTSFVAVDEKHITQGGVASTVHVPLEIPHGVSPSSTFASSEDLGNGWGRGGDGGGGFGAIPSTMRKRCSVEDRMKQLRANGGTPDCEVAVKKSLDWLKEQQSEDGSWGETHHAAATGIALLTFLGHCDTPLSEEYGETVLKAITFLIKQSSAHKGLLIDQVNDPLCKYEHAIATMALAEAYIFNQQLAITVPSLKEVVLAAGQHIINNALLTGGWASINESPTADTQLTNLNLQTLKICKHTNLDFRGLSACASKAIGVLKDRKDFPSMITQSYQQWGKGETHEALVAFRAIDRKTPFQGAAGNHDLWTVYFNTNAIFYKGGKTWADYNASLLPEILKAQNADGSYSVPGDPDTNNVTISHYLTGKSAAHFRTCLCTLTLEVYYRYVVPER